jgi:hypothetical protein
MAHMVRKQIYIQKYQQAVLSRLARALGVSESEVIRRTIDRQASSSQPESVRPDPVAWEQAHRFMMELHARGPLAGPAGTWRREDLYAERISLRVSYSW